MLEQRFRPAFAILFASFVLFGISVTVIGAALPRVLADFHWDYVSAGYVIASSSIGYFVTAYMAGRMVDRIGFRTCMAIGLTLDAIGLFVFALVPSVLVNALLFFLIGVGQGFIEVAVNWSVVKMAPEASGRPMSIIHGAFSIGAVTGPVAVGAIIAAGLPWEIVYRILGGLFTLLLAASLWVPARGLNGSTAVQAHHRAELYRESTFWLGFAVLMLYVGVEMGISNWMSEYFVSVLGSTASLGAFAVSAFWAGLLAGRFGVPLIYRGSRQDKVLYVLGGILTAAAGMLAVAGFSKTVSLGFSASALAGFGCSCIYPISMSLVGEAFPDAQGEAMGFASSGGGAGSFLFPLVTAFVAKSWGLQTGYVAFVFLAAIVLGACALLSTAARRRRWRKGQGSVGELEVEP